MPVQTKADGGDDRANAIVVAVACQKGGVGKTTSALALAERLTMSGFRVLLVDLDAQGNATYATGLTGERNAFAALQRPAEAKREIQKSGWGMDVLASVPALANADSVFAETGREYLLREVLEPIAGDYDYIVVDTPPSLGVLTVNALAAAQFVVVPTPAEMFGAQGLHQLAQTVGTVRKYCNPKLEIAGVLLTRFNGRTVIRREVARLLEETARQIGAKVFSEPVRECTAVVEAQAVRQGVFSYAPKSNAALDLDKFVDELLVRMGRKEERNG